jgi:hypothetical protein
MDWHGYWRTTAGGRGDQVISNSIQFCVTHTDRDISARFANWRLRRRQLPSAPRKEKKGKGCLRHNPGESRRGMSESFVWRGLLPRRGLRMPHHILQVNTPNP